MSDRIAHSVLRIAELSVAFDGGRKEIFAFRGGDGSGGAGAGCANTISRQFFSPQIRKCVVALTRAPCVKYVTFTSLSYTYIHTSMKGVCLPNPPNNIWRRPERLTPIISSEEMRGHSRPPSEWEKYFAIKSDPMTICLPWQLNGITSYG